MNHSMISDYMAHGFCFSWEPRLVRIHVGSDILTGLAEPCLNTLTRRCWKPSKKQPYSSRKHTNG